MSVYRSNPELKDVSDLELTVRLEVLNALVHDNLSDPRVSVPLLQMETLLDELLARKVEPIDQVISLNTLNLHGEAHLG